MNQTENLREIALALYDFEKEKIDYAIEFNKWCYENHYIFLKRSWYVEQPNGTVDLSNPKTDKELIELHLKTLTHD